jgi:hypothetical protein
VASPSEALVEEDADVDLSGSEPAHLVALSAPPPGDPQQVVVPPVRELRPEDELPCPLRGSTPQETSDAAAKLIEEVMPLAMREANIFSLCYDAARDIVVRQQVSESRDAVSISEAMFSPGTRTPLETAIPQIAIEIYKNVRTDMAHWTIRADKWEREQSAFMRSALLRGSFTKGYKYRVRRIRRIRRKK